MKMTHREPSFTPREESQLLKTAAALLRDAPLDDAVNQCPSDDKLEKVADRLVRLEDAAALVEHIASCPHCFKKYSAFRLQHKARVKAIQGVAALAAGVLIAVLVWVQIGSGALRVPANPEPSRASSSEQVTATVPLALDLSKFGVARSDAPANLRGVFRSKLPCARLRLSIRLPIGSEDGRYEVAVKSDAGERLVSASGDMRVQDYVEVLPVDVDLSSLVPGNYILAVRRIGYSWREYSIALVPQESR